jgi:hypothetical protein
MDLEQQAVKQRASSAGSVLRRGTLRSAGYAYLEKGLLRSTDAAGARARVRAVSALPLWRNEDYHRF